MAAATAAAGSASAVSRPCPTARRCRGGPRRPRATRAGTAFASAVSSGRSPSDAVSLPLIDGPCVWRGPELRAAPELWTHRLTASEIAELDAALARARAANLDVIDLTPETFPLPSLAPRLRALRDELVLGRGVYLFRGLPVQRWDRWETCAAFYGLGAHMGWTCPQNARGHVLGHVKDLGNDPNDPATRLYTTSAAQPFHTDSADIVGLLCVKNAARGVLHAQQAHDVGAVRVERLRGGRRVQPRRRVVRVVPEVLHVTEHVPPRVLRTRPPHVRAEAVERRARLPAVPALNGQAAEQVHAPPEHELVAQRAQTRRERRQGEGLGRQVDHVQVGGARARQRSVELRDLARGQAVRPQLGRGAQLGAAPHARAVDEGQGDGVGGGTPTRDRGRERGPRAGRAGAARSPAAPPGGRAGARDRRGRTGGGGGGGHVVWPTLQLWVQVKPYFFEDDVLARMRFSTGSRCRRLRRRRLASRWPPPPMSSKL